jgi:hypothetical protein
MMRQAKGRPLDDQVSFNQLQQLNIQSIVLNDATLFALVD